jgi:hypothetical protein
MTATRKEKRTVEIEVDVPVIGPGVPEGAMAYAVGQEVVVFCANYIYGGKIVNVTSQELVLDDPYIIYETGDFAAAQWKNFQRLPTKQARIERTAIESHFALQRG